MLVENVQGAIEKFLAWYTSSSAIEGWNLEPILTQSIQLSMKKIRPLAFTGVQWQQVVCRYSLRLILENWGKPHLTILVFSTTQIADFINWHNLIQNVYWSDCLTCWYLQILGSARSSGVRTPERWHIKFNKESWLARYILRMRNSRPNYWTSLMSSDSPEP